MKLRFLLSEEGEVGGRKAVVQDVRSSTKMKIKRGYGVRRKNEELGGGRRKSPCSLQSSSQGTTSAQDSGF